MRAHIPETPLTKGIVAGICSYETAAIVSSFLPNVPTLPTITALNRRWPAVGAVLVGALAVHFWAPDPVVLTIPPN